MNGNFIKYTKSITQNRKQLGKSNQKNAYMCERVQPKSKKVLNEIERERENNIKMDIPLMWST